MSFKLKRPIARDFFSLQSPRRVLGLLVIGLLLIFLAYDYRISQRPKELSAEETAIGLEKVQQMIDMVRQSEFGQTERGRKLTQQAQYLLQNGRIKFSAGLEMDSLYRKEFGSRSVLYIAVLRGRASVLWFDAESLARRIYHEVLHATVNSKRKSKEEECDAFCAAEEAAATVEKRPPRYPVMRDGQSVWEWVHVAYPDIPSDPSYQPVDYTFAELAARTGMGIMNED